MTSGAIGAGMRMMGIDKRPSDVGRLQSLAAVGQCRLMALYERSCQAHGFHCGQILLSADDVRDRKRHLNLRNCLASLLARDVLPIINENDSVSVDEICFGDNDKLAALVASLIRAELTILLTTVDGLCRREGKQIAGRISVVPAITEDLHALAGGTDGNPYSTGGMGSKLLAAEITVASGEAMWIANGTDFAVLQRIRAGEDVGTLFLPAASRMAGNKRYLAFFSDAVGQVIVDDGAANALRKRGKSLLPSGIRQVTGVFEKGDTVDIITTSGEHVGHGISNYCAADLDKIKGLKSAQIHTVLAREGYDEAIHRDNLVILEG